MWSHHFHEWGSTNSTDLPNFLFSSVERGWFRGSSLALLAPQPPNSPLLKVTTENAEPRPVGAGEGRGRSPGGVKPRRGGAKRGHGEVSDRGSADGRRPRRPRTRSNRTRAASGTAPPRGPYTCRRDCTTRKREATYAPSVYDAFAAGLAPVPWKSEYAADWFTKTPPSRFSDSATPASSAASRMSATTSSDVE